MNKKTLFLILTMLSLTTVLVFVGCEFEKPMVVNEETEAATLNIPIFQLEYDSKVVATSPQWPGSIITPQGNAKTMDGDTEYLVDYANTHETFTVDKDGYISTYTEWIEGNADIPMPIDMWDQIKDDTNPFHPSHNPMVAFEFNHGIYTAYGEDGSVISTSTYELDSMRFNPDEINLDSLAYFLGGTTISDSTNNKMDAMLIQFGTQGINAKALGENEIVCEIIKEYGKSKIVFNTQTGLINRTAVYNTTDELELVTLYKYTNTYGMILPVQTINYSIGERIDGTRGVLTKTIETKTNIQLSWYGK